MRETYRSFAGGEITPELVTRADLPQNQTGLALCDNFIVRQNGTLTRRGGWRHICTIGRVLDGAFPFIHPQIIPFTLPNGDQAGIVVGCGFNGADAPVVVGTRVAETTLAVNVVSVSGLNVTVNASVPLGTILAPAGFINGTVGAMFVVETSTPVGSFSVLTFKWLTGFSLTLAELQRYITPGTILHPVFFVPSAPLNSSGGEKRYRFSQENDVTTVTIEDGSFIYTAEVSLTSVSPLTFNAQPMNFSLVVHSPINVNASPTIATGTGLRADRYYVSSVGPDGTSESLTTPSAIAPVNNLQTDGNYNTVTWSPPTTGPTPIAYRIYYAPGDTSARVFVGETAGTTFIHDKRARSDDATKPIVSAPATESFRAVAHHEQRRFFGGSVTKPQTVFGSRINAPSNFSTSFPLRADDALVFRLNSTQRSSIQHLVTFIDLLAFTQNSIFRVYSSDNGALRPASLAAKPQGTVGANDTQPVVTPTSVMFAQAGGDKLRELTANYDGNGFATIDAGVYASHLFYKRGIFSLTYTQSPDSVVWLVNHAGSNPELVAYDTTRLLGMTYVPELQMRAWHRHSMTPDARILAVRSLRVGFVDYLYAIVARKLPGANFLYDINIERMEQSNTTTDHYDGAHLDSHVLLTNSLPPGPIPTPVSGLHHLAGKTVSALIDGAVAEGIAVDAEGNATLPFRGQRMLIGLPYSSRIKTLPLWGGLAGMKKNINGVRVRALNSSFLNVGPSFDRLTTYQGRDVSTPHDTAQPLTALEARMAIGPSWNDDGSVCIEQSMPLPLTVCGFSVDVAPGG